MSALTLTRTELSAAAFIIDAALEDEEPSAYRAALVRVLKKLRTAGAADYASVISRGGEWHD